MITGGQGLLGSALRRRFARSSFEVVSTAQKKQKGFVCLDLRASDAHIARVIHEQKPDLLIHTAAMTDVDLCEQNPKRCHRINTKAVQVLSETCLSLNAFFLHLSTDFVFDGKKGPYSEEDATGPLNRYGLSKLESEQVLKSSGLRHAIVRTCLVYGTPPPNNFLSFLKAHLQKKECPLVADQVRTPTWVEHLAAGCEQIVTREIEGTFHIAGKEGLSPHDIGLTLAQHLNLSTARLKPVSSRHLHTHAPRPLKAGLNIEKARKLLTYEPSSFKQVLDEVFPA